MKSSKLVFSIFTGGFCLFLFVVISQTSLSIKTNQVNADVTGAATIYLPYISRPYKTTTERISESSTGAPANGLSSQPSISADGRFIAFTSDANNLVANDNNGFTDIFVYDRATDESTLVSVTSDGAQANGESFGGASISPDGRFVTFASDATNLVGDDTNGFTDIFVHDRQTGETTIVSISSNGIQSNEDSRYPAISEGGRYVVFESLADNLVASDTNDQWDIFVHDRQIGETKRVSVASNGTQSNGISYFASISADGRFISFTSFANNLVIGDTNLSTDTFIHDQQNGTTIRASVSSDGTQANQGSYGKSSISSDGRFLAFASLATNLVNNDTNEHGDIFVFDQQTAETTRVSLASDGTQANWGAGSCNISADGRFVVFMSDASNLVPEDTNGFQDIFLHDRHIGTTIRVSQSDKDTQASKHSFFSAISANGTVIAFDSVAWNLVDGDTNGFIDVFIRILGLE